MHQQDLVTVYTLTDHFKAEIIKNALQSEGIRCVLDGINQAENVGLQWMEINVQVPAEYADHARKVILAHEEHLKKAEDKE